MPGPVLVVGTGLVGTSIALGLTRRGVEVALSDSSPTALAVARDLGAGTPLSQDGSPPRLVVVAVPPDVTADVAVTSLRRWPQAVVTDVASVKVPVVRAVAAAGPDLLARFVGGHPMAGRERSGPMAARADLFDARPWVLTPSGPGSDDALSVVEDLAHGLGAVTVRMDPQEHDGAVAVVSHLPQVAASLVAARLRGVDERAVALAGQGLRDVTRIAASDPLLWAQILSANAGPVREVLRGVREDLDRVLSALDLVVADGEAPDEGRGPRAQIAGLVQDGNEGHALVPGKHGGGPVAYALVSVVVPDRPGAIARLLTEVGETGVNLEDIRIEHSLGRPTGVVEIAVAPAARETLMTRLGEAGWTVAA